MSTTRKNLQCRPSLSARDGTPALVYDNIDAIVHGLTLVFCSNEHRRQKMAEWMFKVIDFYVSEGAIFPKIRLCPIPSHPSAPTRGLGLGQRYRQHGYGLFRSNVYDVVIASYMEQATLHPRSNR